MITRIISIMFIIVFMSLRVSAQTAKAKTGSTKPKSSTGKTTAAPKKAAPPVIGKEVTVTLKNSDEHNVSVFSGPRSGLAEKEIKMKEVGGLSKNTIYVHVNEVVCILDEKKKPKACADIKATTTSLEINSSGTIITAK